MSDLKPTQRQIELYSKMRDIAEPHHMYQNQIMAIAEWIDAEFTHKSQANDADKPHEKALPMCGVVQQRELLTAFSDWMFMQHYHEPPTRELIDEYLGGL